MRNSHKKTDWLRAHTARLVLLLILLQPLMDILSFWLDRLGISNAPTLLLRLLVLAGMMLAGFLLSDRKKIYWIAAGISLFVGVGHVFACIQAGYHAPIQDLTNYIRVLQMPWTAICLITFLRQGDAVYVSMKKGLTAALFIILAVEILASLTGTEPHTYMDGKGYIGWFNNTNSQSAILTMLVPVAMAWLYGRNGFRSPLFWLAALGGFTAMYFLGTRLCFLGIVASSFGLAVSIVLIRLADWKRALVFLLTPLIFLGCMPWSPMVQHQKIYEEVQSDRQASIDQTMVDSTLPPLNESEASEAELSQRKEAWIEALTPIYSFYAPDFVELFGARKTIEMYNYAWNIKTITALRPKKLQFARLLMNDSPLSARFFGLELSRFTINGNIYDVENDLHGIYFLYGLAGLIVMLAFLLYFIGLILWALFKNAKFYFTLDAASCGIALIMCLIHVYCTAGVLRRPNASFYLSAILASIYYLVRIRTCPPAAPEGQQL